MPSSFSQYASVPATSRNGRPEANPNSAIVPAAGCAKARQIEGLRAEAATGSVGIVDRVGRMVRETLIAVDRAIADAFAQGRRADLVVDPPSDIALARTATVGPPGVLDRLGLDRTEAVDPAAGVEQKIEPSPLGRQTAGVLLVGGPVLDVVAGVDNVPVAADHVVAAAVEPLVEDRREEIHGLELELLALLARGARRHVQRDHRQVAEARLDVAPLAVE